MAANPSLMSASGDRGNVKNLQNPPSVREKSNGHLKTPSQPRRLHDAETGSEGKNSSSRKRPHKFSSTTQSKMTPVKPSTASKPSTSNPFPLKDGAFQQIRDQMATEFFPKTRQNQKTSGSTSGAAGYGNNSSSLKSSAHFNNSPGFGSIS